MSPNTSVRFTSTSHSLRAIRSIPYVDRGHALTARRCLKPGGFVELAEFDANLYSDDNSIPADWPPMRSIALTVKAVEAIGREFFNGDKMSKLLEAAGFVDIVVYTTFTFKHSGPL